MKKNGIIKVKVATSNIRGFLIGLFQYPFDKIKFIYNSANVYQVFRKNKQRLYSIYGKLYWLIPFQIIKASSEGQDINFSYNRFLESDQPYVIYLENPSALVNYSWRVLLNHMFSNRIKKCLSDKKLKAIICMSQACRKTLPIYYQIPKHIKVDTIYPLVPDDKSWNIDCIQKKAKEDILECLFVAQKFQLKGGEDAVEAILRLEKEKYSIHLTIITRQENIRQEYIEKISGSRCIELVEFGMDKEKLNEFYKKAAVFLYPSRWDSFSLVTLEAMKYGCALITTDLYALKEMVTDGENGYLLKPYYRDWNEDDTPNMKVKYHHKETISSGFIDEKLIEHMCSILRNICADRKQLEDLCLNSYEKAINGCFSEKKIAKSWKQLLEDLD